MATLSVIKNLGRSLSVKQASRKVIKINVVVKRRIEEFYIKYFKFYYSKFYYSSKLDRHINTVKLLLTIIIFISTGFTFIMLCKLKTNEYCRICRISSFGKLEDK